MKNNRQSLPEKIIAGETLEAVQLCPFGEYPNGKSVQLCDEAAFRQIVERHAAEGSPEILCDFEHRSEDPSLTSDTAAAAWISCLAVCERGLVGDLRFTDIGAEAVSNRRLRFLSPVWTLDAEGRPDRLKSVALTNKPNIPVACVLNREPQPAIQPVEEQAKENPEMDELKKMLGLPPEATDAEVVAAVKALQDQLAAANKEKDEAEAESFAEEHKACCNKEALKSAYLMNKEAAKALVAGYVRPAPAAPAQTVLNKDTVATPETKANKAQAGLAACRTPEERIAYVTSHAEEFK